MVSLTLLVLCIFLKLSSFLDSSYSACQLTVISSGCNPLFLFLFLSLVTFIFCVFSASAPRLMQGMYPIFPRNCWLRLLNICYNNQVCELLFNIGMNNTFILLVWAMSVIFCPWRKTIIHPSVGKPNQCLPPAKSARMGRNANVRQLPISLKSDQK